MAACRAIHAPPCKGRPGGAHRKFFDALLWMDSTGAPWRDLPERLGRWSVVYQRYAYWCKKGHFERLFQGVQQPDVEEVMMDSTCCRAHQASAGARKISGPQAIGITRGGLNTKIHAVCDALGNPLRFVLTPGQRHDSKPVPELLEGLRFRQDCPGHAGPRHGGHHPVQSQSQAAARPGQAPLQGAPPD